jgi:hypothetical protein
LRNHDRIEIMRKVKVYALMCEVETGAFVTGICTEKKIYTEQEFENNKHKELTKGIEMLDGGSWSWLFNWIKNESSRT